MIKVLPFLMAIFISVVHFQVYNTDSPVGEEIIVENKNPRNHLTQDSVNRNEVTAKIMTVGEASSKDAMNLAVSSDIAGDSNVVPERNPDITVIRLTWELVPFAVKYKVICQAGEFISYTSGIEIEIAPGSADQKFQIIAVDYDGNTLADDVKIVSREINPTAPLTTTEFDKMDYSPAYLVYSWIPVKDADHYEIQLIHNNNIAREFVTEYHPQDDNFDFYDTDPILEDGEYFWRVRGLTADDTPVTAWSEKNDGNSFVIKKPVRFCAIGDSITHGGGSISVPPSNVLYNWETYCKIPVKNLGKSGDTTDDILDRFERDVLPFRPEVLFIMAGVNDYRSAILGWHSVMNLKALQEKCSQYKIKPVFITPTPINAKIMRKIKFVEDPPSDWKTHMKYICDWMRKQENCIDINEQFLDGDENLRADFTTDGLHPDVEGKEIIGGAVGDWLNKYLDSLIPVD